MEKQSVVSAETLARIEAFWAAWPQTRESALAMIQAMKEGRKGDEEAAHVVVSRAVAALGDFGWRVGTNEAGKHQFVVTCEGDRKRRHVTQAWFERAPVEPEWQFHPAIPREGCMEVIMRDDDVFPVAEFRILYLVKAGKVALSIYHPKFRKHTDRACYGVVFNLLDDQLGEDDVRCYVGALDLKRTCQRGLPWCTIQEAVAAVDALKAKVQS